MKTIFLFILVGLVLNACSGAEPTATPAPVAPTVDIAAVQTQAASAVFATQTASVPTATPTTLASETPKPTSTVTPRPTQTPLPPISVPEGWTSYVAVTERFSLAHPEGWGRQDEKAESIYFDTGNFSGVGVGFDSFAFSASPEDDINAWFEYVADGERNSISDPQKGIWDDGVHKGVFVEYASFDDIYDVWGYNIKVAIPTDKGTIFVIYFRAGTKTESDNLRETLKKLSATVRVPED